MVAEASAFGMHQHFDLAKLGFHQIGSQPDGCEIKKVIQDSIPKAGSSTIMSRHLGLQ